MLIGMLWCAGTIRTPEYSASYCYTGRKKNVDLGNRADMSMPRLMAG